MIIQAVVVECIIHDAMNLKEKRSVLKRILTRARQKFNVSIAETAFKEKWQRTEISFAVVSDTRVRCEKETDQVLSFLDSFPEWERIKTEKDWV
ncbi:DUF503 domain-containing protein [Listeria aquatica]|uniref:YlxP-like protein n=2 Tax=Listeria aquatica TaxID=1494960 RepID=W7AU12_9LIST|nr:DUF503 family protein [Listeria aquatica]EUJ18619.1 hypothetical protein MAQA_08477 [Listeria aquatica FSL S10-1188]MBC1521122.1 DUF503 family protein [Listeria aquatica]